MSRAVVEGNVSNRHAVASCQTFLCAMSAVLRGPLGLRSSIGELVVGGGAYQPPHSRPPELEEIMDRAHEGELALHADQAAQREAPKAAPLDLPDDRLHGTLASSVDRPTPFRAQLAPHPLLHTQPRRDPPPWRPGR